MWFCYSETLMPLTNDRRPRGVALFSAKAQKEAFAHKFHRRLLPQHQTGVCIHQHHLGTERRASGAFSVSLYSLSSGVSHHLWWWRTSAGFEIFWYTNAKPGHCERHWRRQNHDDEWETNAMVGALPTLRARPPILHPSIPTRQMAHGHPTLPVSLGQKRENSASNIDLAANGLYISILQLKPMRR